MFSHIMIGTNDLDKAKAYYDQLLGTLGIPPRITEINERFIAWHMM